MGDSIGFFDIWYRPRNSVKGQVFIDFVVEFPLKRGLETFCHIDF